MFNVERLLLGELMSGSAGMGFTPHIITIAVGEVYLLLLRIFIIFSFSFCLFSLFRLCEGNGEDILFFALIFSDK